MLYNMQEKVLYACFLHPHNLFAQRAYPKIFSRLLGFCPGVPDLTNPHPKADCGFQAKEISPRL